jgi:hypothetical protein
MRAARAWTYNQVAEEYLQDLGLQALAPLEDLLESANQDVSKGRADQGTVDSHLGDTRSEVVARLAPVVGDPRCKELLQTRQSTRGQHLGAQWVALQLLEVCLSRQQSVDCLITC